MSGTVETRNAERTDAAEGHRLRYAPGLDGVRALAVFAVVAYHIGTTSGATVLPGGFLGVDVFFVLSGYLITSLLIVEVQQTGRISIKKFYIRRARRLLPALFAMLLAVTAVGAFWLPQQAARLRGDLLASLGYATNWWLIAENSSYFATAGDRPPMLTHLWSLAVEEQYYLVWPLVLMLFAVVRARRGLMLFVIAAGVIASTAAGLVMYDPFSNPSRVYYGTDTRALAPLLGGLLAIAVKPWHHRRRLPRGTRHWLDLLGIAALIGLAVVAATLHDTDDLLYLGGFLGIAILGGIVVCVAGHPGTALGEMLGTQPLKWLGERSYAIYLWHWPVCLLTRPGLDVPLTDWANAGLRVGISILLAEISYRLIEAPIRRYGFLAPLKAPRAAASTSESSAVDSRGLPAPHQHPLRTPTGPHPLRTPTGPHPVRAAVGQHAVGQHAVGQHAVRMPTGQHPLRLSTGQHPARIPTGQHAAQAVHAAPAVHSAHVPYAPQPRGGGVYASAVAVAPSVGTRAGPSIPGGHGAGVPTRRARGPVVRTVVLAIAMVAGGSWFGVRLTEAASSQVAGGPLDLGPAATLGPLTNGSPTAQPPRPIPVGSTVAFFGDSQGMTLILNKPADLENYIDAVDATIEGCGILLGRMESRSGERRNLSGHCDNWRSTWTEHTERYEPALAIIMLGAWDVFDVTLDSGQTLAFGTPQWDLTFTRALERAIDTLRSAGTDVALSLLPCYRPIEASAGFWPERGDDDRTRHVNELLRTEARSHLRGVRTLEPPKAFCTDPAIGGDTSYRWDGVHYYKKGAALYFATILPQILAPEPGPSPTPTASP